MKTGRHQFVKNIGVGMLSKQRLAGDWPASGHELGGRLIADVMDLRASASLG